MGGQWTEASNEKNEREVRSSAEHGLAKGNHHWTTSVLMWCEKCATWNEGSIDRDSHVFRAKRRAKTGGLGIWAEDNVSEWQFEWIPTTLTNGVWSVVRSMG